MTFKCIIFDFDGTLADSKECSILSTQRAFQDMELHEPDEQTIEYFMGIPIEKSFIEMADKKLSESELERLITTFRKYYKELENQTLSTFDGISSMLKQIKELNIPCFVLSSKKTDVLNRNLITLKIDCFFTESIGSDKVSHYKPHPDGINYILSKYSIPSDQAIMIGDAIFDIQMGQAAKVKTGAVMWGSHDKNKLTHEQPTILFRNPSEINDYISNLEK